MGEYLMPTACVCESSHPDSTLCATLQKIVSHGIISTSYIAANIYQLPTLKDDILPSIDMNSEETTPSYIENIEYIEYQIAYSIFTCNAARVVWLRKMLIYIYAHLSRYEDISVGPFLLRLTYSVEGTQYKIE